MSTTLQPTEVDRLHALAKFALLDTAPEPEFERITAHTARIFKVPMALVSLVDAHRQWFKSHHGTTLCETPRDQAFCAHTILENRPLIHRHKAMRVFRLGPEAEGFVFASLPGYAPDLNPLDTGIWHHLNKPIFDGGPRTPKKQG